MRDDPGEATTPQPSSGSFDVVSEFVFGLETRDFPHATLEKAALLFLDTIGICAAAAPMEAGRIGRETAHRFFGSPDASASAQMLFDGRSASLPGAVFAAATQIDNLDGHDGYNPTKGHIGVVAAPTLAALAYGRPDLTGQEALTALVLGYEVAGRAGIALHASVSDYHTSGAWNALGVAAMAARVRGLSKDQLREAFGIAEYHGPRSQMMREIANPTMLHDGSGWGALAGMTAAAMAEQGFTGAPALTIEDAEAAPHWADLGEFWQVDHQYIKPYPVCRWAHPAIDAARELMQKHELCADDIAEIRIATFDNAVALIPGMPDTSSKAQYSLPFAVAAQIVHGTLGLAQISGAGLSDPHVADLVERTVLVAEPRHEARFPEGRWADVRFTLTNGRNVTSGDVHARGGPERPVSAQEIVAKYHEFADAALGRARATALAEAILALPREGSAFSEVAQHLYAPL
ncbi:MAG: MmgE/PrpD family protein [Pseudomonadota bacterium]